MKVDTICYCYISKHMTKSIAELNVPFLVSNVDRTDYSRI